MIKLVDGKIGTFNKKALQNPCDFVRHSGAEVDLSQVLSRFSDVDKDQIADLRAREQAMNQSYDSASALIREYAALVRRYIKALTQTPVDEIFASKNA